MTLFKLPFGLYRSLLVRIRTRIAHRLTLIRRKMLEEYASESEYNAQAGVGKRSREFMDLAKHDAELAATIGSKGWVNFKDPKAIRQVVRRCFENSRILTIRQRPL